MPLFRVTGCACLTAWIAFAASADPNLSAAVKKMDRDAVRALIEGRADVNAAEPDGTTPLHWAAHRDDVETAELLIKAGANVSAANRYRVTPLELACTNGDGRLVEMLLKAGASPNTVASGGETVLMTAARTGRVEAVKALLDAGAEVNAKEPKRGQTALIWAANEGHTAVVETLLAKGADFRTRLASGFTPLLFAVREGHAGVVRALLKAGADANDTVPPNMGTARYNQGRGGPRSGTSALIVAVVNAHYEVAAQLLEAGANPNANGPGYTALHAITWVRKPGVGDNDPAPRGSGSMTSLEFVKHLAARGADLNARMTRRIGVGMTSLNTAGATAYVLAARTGDAEMMRTLVQLGADPKIPTNDNATALIVAAGLGTRSPGEDAGTESEVMEAVRVALEHGADINAVDNNGETAMHGAAYKNLPGVVQLLAEAGADPQVWNRPNKQGWTPLTIAEGHRFGNYKPSPDTIAAFHRVMKSAGIPIPRPKLAGDGVNSDYVKP